VRPGAGMTVKSAPKSVFFLKDEKNPKMNSTRKDVLTNFEVQ
jgi:hypothetical protein